ncbi:MAG: helix-turn-helix domain-containing protein [Candidatus Parcubacteria bacterium]|nr:helix-turn-helix domain-containing protein [Candidatus Parcubacteria bacterium]
MINKHYTVPELAKILGISRVAVFNKVKNGQIRAEKIGRNYVIMDEDITDILQKDLTAEDKAAIKKNVKKIWRDYGETLRLLGKE